MADLFQETPPSHGYQILQIIKSAGGPYAASWRQLKVPSVHIQELFGGPSAMEWTSANTESVDKEDPLYSTYSSLSEI